MRHKTARSRPGITRVFSHFSEFEVTVLDLKPTRSAYGVGAMSAVAAHEAAQAPSPKLHEIIAAGAAGAATAPKVKPAAA